MSTFYPKTNHVILIQIDGKIGLMHYPETLRACDLNNNFISHGLY